jgi:CRISPR system Cascade subunit CasB
MNKVLEKNPFVDWLEKNHEDRAILASLRRGLGQAPGTAVDMFRYVVPFIPNDAGPQKEAVYYMIASLFSLHPVSAPSLNLGQSFAQVVIRNPGSQETVERRFANLLAASFEDMDFVLRQSISFLKSNEVGINWDQLFKDLLYWDHPQRFVQKRWANAFWGNHSYSESINQ